MTKYIRSLKARRFYFVKKLFLFSVINIIVQKRKVVDYKTIYKHLNLKYG